MAKIYIFGVISSSDWEGYVSAKDIAAQLDEIGDNEEVTAYINSPGGDVFEGHAIYNLLSELKDRLTIKIIGQASSIASEIACAAGEGKTLIADNGMMLFHYPWTFGIIDEEYLEKIQKELKSIKESIYTAYRKKTGLSQKKLDDLLAKNTYHNAKECVKLGFADRTWNPSEDEQDIISQSTSIVNNAMDQLRHNAYQNLVNMSKPEKIEELNIKIDKELLDLLNRGGGDMPNTSDSGNVSQHNQPQNAEVKAMLENMNKYEARIEEYEAKVKEQEAKEKEFDQIEKDYKDHLSQAKAEIEKITGKYEALEKEKNEIADKLILAAVEKDLSTLNAAKKILPTEKTDEGIMLNIGGQKISKGQLLNMKRNEDTLRLSEDVSVYDHIIKQIEAREPMGGLNKTLPDVPQDNGKPKVSNGELKEFKDFVERFKQLGEKWMYDKYIDAYIENYANEHNINYDQATSRLVEQINKEV